MMFRCPKCGYKSLPLYPSTEEEWNQPCPDCGNIDLEYFHLGYPFGINPNTWVNSKGEVVEELPFPWSKNVQMP